MLWVRRDWLDKVNMEVPTTIEETVAESITSWGAYLSRSQVKELNRSLGSVVRLLSLIPDEA